MESQLSWKDKFRQQNTKFSSVWWEQTKRSNCEAPRQASNLFISILSSLAIHENRINLNNKCNRLYINKLFSSLGCKLLFPVSLMQNWMTKMYTNRLRSIHMHAYVYTHAHRQNGMCTHSNTIHTHSRHTKTSTTKKPTLSCLLYAKNVNRRQYFWLGNEN